MKSKEEKDKKKKSCTLKCREERRKVYRCEDNKYFVSFAGMWPDEITYVNHTIGRGFEKMNPSIPKRGRVGSLPSNSLSQAC